MSVKIMSLVWERDDLDPHERLVMLSLADHADDEGECFPSISRLCKRTGMRERGVQMVIKRLREKGLISVEMNAGRKGANLYTIHADPRTGCTPAQDAPPHPMSSDPRTGCTRNVIEPSKEKEPPIGGSKKKASRLSPDWALPLPWGDWALAEGLPEPAVQREADRFRDYWLAKAGRDGCKLDWQATWRNWVRKALDDARRQSPDRRQARPEIGEHRVFFNRNCGVRQVRAWTGVEWSHVEDLEEERR